MTPTLPSSCLTEIVLSRRVGIAVEESATFWRCTDRGEKERITLPIAVSNGLFRAYGDAILLDVVNRTAYRVNLRGAREVLPESLYRQLFHACRRALHSYSNLLRCFDAELAELEGREHA